MLLTHRFRLWRNIRRIKSDHKKQKTSVEELNKTIMLLEYRLRRSGKVSETTFNLAEKNIDYWLEKQSFQSTLVSYLQMILFELKKLNKEKKLVHALIYNTTEKVNSYDLFFKTNERFNFLLNSTMLKTIREWRKEVKSINRKEDLEASFNTLQNDIFSY